MKTIILSIFFLLNTSLYAQWHENFDQIPIKGKIKSYLIYKVWGDSLNLRTRDIEEIAFDKNGQILTAKYYNMESDGLRKQVKNILKPDETISYECDCPNIDTFIKNFEFRDIAELKNKPKMGTSEAPTDWVTVKTLDKQGNVILLKTYSSSGYLIREVSSSFDLQKRLLTKEVFGFKHVFSYSERNTYDKNGNLVEKISKEGKFSKDYIEKYRWDSEKNLVEEMKLEDTVIISHFQYQTKKVGNKEEFIKQDKLSHSGYLKEVIFYNADNLEIKKIEYNEDSTVIKTIISEYYKNKKIRSQSFLDHKDRLFRKIEFTNDKNNNWTIWTRNIFYNDSKDSKLSYTETTIYKLKIEYW